MIKIALKQFILESCINMMFDRIDSNFKDYWFKVGDRIPILHVESGNKKEYVRYHDVVIKSINDPNYDFPSICIEYKYGYGGYDNCEYQCIYDIEITYKGTIYYCVFYKKHLDRLIWTDNFTMSTT